MIKTDEGLIAYEFKASDAALVKAGQRVRAHYRCQLLEDPVEELSEGALRDRLEAIIEGGNYLENTWVGEPIKFVLGEGEVLKGVDQAMLNMNIGGTWRMVIPPELAFGKRGVPTRETPIPPDTTLVFEVYLIEAE